MTDIDIVERLEEWVKKDQLYAFDWGEPSFDIEPDIQDAIDEIKRLRDVVAVARKAVGETS